MVSASAVSAAPLRPQVNPVAPATGFGGYRWTGIVGQISATWRVPRISRSSLAGDAATWIGAQSRIGPPFFQVGTVETEQPNHIATYNVFWSDTTVNFDAQVLLVVKAGDVISASMRRVPSGWSVAVTDRTSGATVTRTITYTVPGVYGQAEWLQEDPVGALVAAQDLPYPTMSRVAFTHLLVNDAAPHLTLSDGQTLQTSDGTNFVPSVPRAGGFRFYTPRGPALHYMRDAFRVNQALSSFSAELTGWTTLSSTAQATDEQAIVAAYQKFAQELQTQAWPAKARPSVALLITAATQVVSALTSWAQAGYSLNSAQWLTVRQTQNSQHSSAVRAALGLPPA
jgi:hypothetical protein